MTIYADGYIVFEDEGSDPINYGATEKWFASYDEAIEYAMSIVKERVEKGKTGHIGSSVMVYKGNIIPSNIVPIKVVFCWSNYYRGIVEL